MVSVGSDEPLVETQDVLGDTTTESTGYRRRLGRSYFIPPALWSAPRETARERHRQVGPRR
ncbi:hypothetical protein MCHLDSM_00245 [Mycolicibacterium chlorophenolicum]|uniref:Uncharacterized protein n=1 Tax=Mycolicibacterium chlorophenolicum TaxID=37916 RepID=A0A0J6WKC3_9MYCO|nr:hypothetical protein MCHLDSM_00245 [Mycolicibacterium chlorophenolicum]